jgi:hypothetical protein
MAGNRNCLGEIEQVNEQISEQEAKAEVNRSIQGLVCSTLPGQLAILDEIWRAALEWRDKQAEPVVWKHDCAALCANDVELWIDRCPHCGKPRHRPSSPAVAQEPVHFRAVICKEQQEQALGVVPKIVGFVDKKAAEQFILEKRDFQGWKYNLEPLYAEAPAVAQPIKELDFGMAGGKMFFEIGVQRFTLDYEPELTEDFEFMKKALTDAINSITHGVKTSPSVAQPPADVVRELVGALREFLEAVEEPPEPNCCCHISPPCADCVENSHLRDAFKKGKSALKSAKEHGL